MDAETTAPLPGVSVTATSPALQGEQAVLTDSSGTYRLPNLPAGRYAVRLAKDGYRPLAHEAIDLRTDATVRLNAELLPVSVLGEEVLVVGAAPTIDQTASWTGVRISSDVTDRLPLIRPGERNAAMRSFEPLAELAPGARADRYGVSLTGTTSPENQYLIDGLSVNDPGFGILGTPLTMEFVQEVHVVTGGYMPEFGRATGGVLNVVTKSGSNEFRGSVFATGAGGALEGRPRPVASEGIVFRHDAALWNEGNFGAELSGPVFEDRLWFYAGFAPGATRRDVSRRVTPRRYPLQQDPETGASLTDEVLASRHFADQQSFHYLGKLTWAVAADHHLTLSAFGAPSRSGGTGEFGINPQSGQVEVPPTMTGDFGALAHRYDASATDVAAKYSAAFLEKRILLDVTSGWHRQTAARLPSDGSGLGTSRGLAGVPSTLYLDPLQVTHFVPEVDPARCSATEIAPDGTPATVSLCPDVPFWWGGGPDFLYDAKVDRYQAKAVGTVFANALGHHLIKAGVDVEQMVYDNAKAYSGRARLVGLGGDLYFIHRLFGTLDGDQATLSDVHRARSESVTVGGFVQDSWAVLDLFTVNAGVRFDQQTLRGNDGAVAMVLGGQWSPRIGLIYDFTRQGRSRVFANYARYYESVPLDIVDRQFSGERLLQGVINGVPNGNGNGNPGCDPTRADNECLDERNLVPDEATGARWSALGGESTPVDPDLKPQSTDEWVVGAEYEVLPSGRLGASYTRRSLNHVIEDMSVDEAATYFIGNPGYGLASAFPRAVRDYDAVSVYFDKRFSDLWLAHASYTWSSLRGNYAGLFRPETGQLDPNMNSTFDLVSLLENNDGPLPGDRTHAIKLFASRDFPITDAVRVQAGIGYRARSGEAINALGYHATYGLDEVLIIPRGSGGRLGWEHEFDVQLGYTQRLPGGTALTVTASAFNLLNLQRPTSVDERFTADEVTLPLPPGQTLETLDVTRNPTYGKPDLYQPPRIIRVAAKLAF